MSDIIIEVSNLSKQYRLGQIGTGTVRDDFNRFLAKIRGKEDPTLKVGQTNTLASNSNMQTPDSNYIWALRDINFSVEQGEVLGIIGKNGAGKSTLLKILSKVTAPTTGIVKIKGRLASLLEVGTGFHPELSGRENIFLNGAILGMTKAEIVNKFDEIVDFSGVENYIDTPVKRYSSGMYVRLAFAVAAHLEPEILIVDEVLAVGDVEFQKKAIGKMQDVSQKDGRTVILVSHNLSTIFNLCKKAILLQNGCNAFEGPVKEVIAEYCSIKKQYDGIRTWEEDESSPGSDNVKLHSISLTSNGIITDEVDMQDDFTIELIYKNLKQNIKLNVFLNITDPIGNIIFSTGNLDSINTGKDKWSNQPHSVGLYKSKCKVNKNLLNVGTYSVMVCIHSHAVYHEVFEKDVLPFNVVDKKVYCIEDPRVLPGYFRPKLLWETEKLGN
jgi:lipopolysaccharide transport system ATP-binding protein